MQQAGLARAVGADQGENSPRRTCTSTFRARRRCRSAPRRRRSEQRCGVVRHRAPLASCAARRAQRDRGVDSEDDRQQDQAEGERERQVALACLERDGGGDDAGDAVDVAADDHHRADLGEARPKAVSINVTTAQRSCSSISSARVIGPAPIEPSWSPPSRRLSATSWRDERGDDRQNQDALGDDHRLRREQDAPQSERAAARQHQVDEQPDHDRRQAEQRVQRREQARRPGNRVTASQAPTEEAEQAPTGRRSRLPPATAGRSVSAAGRRRGPGRQRSTGSPRMRSSPRTHGSDSAAPVRTASRRQRQIDEQVLRLQLQDLPSLIARPR